MSEFDEVTHQRMRRNMQEQMAAAQKHHAIAPQRFLAAWIKGVRIVGESYFHHDAPLSDRNLQPAASLDTVTSKWQVSPNYEYILKNISVLSGGEAALLATLCSFYNSEWGGELMREVGLNGMADVSAKLDLDGNQIVADLLINYTGW